VLRVLSPLVSTTRGRRVAVIVACVLAACLVLPLGARGVANRWHEDNLWANSLRSLGGLAVPFDFAVYLGAADDVRAGESPYVAPDDLTEESPAPYVYPPLLAIVVVPATALPDEVGGSSPAGVLVSLFAIACIVGALLAFDVRDWRCYPVALLYPPTLENVEYGALGPVLVLLVALAWRYRERAAAASLSVGTAVVLKVFLWPLVVWLAATRRWTASLGAVVVAAGLALVSWAAVGFSGLGDYPELLRRLSDIEAENSYSTYAIFVALGVPDGVARALTGLLAIVLLGLAWRVARLDRVSGDRRSLMLVLAAGLVATPILWLHYLVLLVVPIALARRTLSAVWFAPLALTVFELLDWYRGWPRGDGPALASVALVTLFVIAVCSLPERPAGKQLAMRAAGASGDTAGR
jgi:alpha-1,2-mannosyltransferase